MWVAVLAATLTAVAYVAAAPGFDQWPWACGALVPLIWAVEHRTRSVRGAIALGLLSGTLANLLGMEWLTETLAKFANISRPVGALLTLLVCVAQGGQLALFAGLLRAVKQREHSVLWMAPLVWAACEWCYPQLFPTYLGAALHVQPRLIQIADLGGPIAVSALVVLVNSASASLFNTLCHRERLNAALLTTTMASVIVSYGYGWERERQIQQLDAHSPQLKVSVIQANVDAASKRTQPIDTHFVHVGSSLRVEADTHPDLLIWPETAVSFVVPAYGDLRRILGPLKTPLLTGALTTRLEGSRLRTFNSALLLDAKGMVQGAYDKNHPLPFSERMPFADEFPALQKLAPQSGTFSAGTEHKPLSLSFHGVAARIGVLICYEDLLPRHARATVNAGANLLVNLTNDGWFGDSRAAESHMALATLRAVENRRYLVRATNDGVSTIIDATGRPIAIARSHAIDSITRTVPLLNTRTLYSKLGDWLGALATALTLSALFMRRRAHHS
jgi:apolipoprotein N-acyltransferase